MGSPRYAVADSHVRSCHVRCLTGMANSGVMRRVSCRRCPAILRVISDSVGTMKLRATLLSFAQVAVVVTVGSDLATVG